MSEVKGRAVARGAAQGARTYIGLLVFQLVLRSVTGITVPALAYVTQALVMMTALTFGVVAVWNLWSWLGDGQAQRRAARDAARAEGLLLRYPAPGAAGEMLLVGIDERSRPVYVPCLPSPDAVWARRGTWTESTLGSVRYMGPPPVVRATKVTYQMKGGTQLIKEIRVTERRMLPSGPVPGSGRCGKCGNPMTQHLYYGSDCCLVDYRL